MRGLTLIELMVTLAVAIVILAIGIPAFNAMSARDTSAATVNALVVALQQGRVEAISRGASVRVTSSNWNEQWAVEWWDAAADTPAWVVLRQFAAPRPGVTTVSGGATIGFTHEGLADPEGVFVVKTYSSSGKQPSECVKVKRVVLTTTGQLRLEDGSCP